MNWRFYSALYLWLNVLAGDCALWGQDLVAEPRVAQQVDFARDVWPILSRNCLSCHGKEEQESGFRIDSREVALSSGDQNAPNIVPGQGSKSNLIRFISGKVDGMQMPPDGPPLPEAQIEILLRWIDQGANWGDVAAAAETAAKNWWSLQPLHSPPVPAMLPGSKNELDAFVRSKLSDMGIMPSPEADRRTLIRRVYFDLIGLPPAPSEVDAFVNSEDPAVYEQLVEQLLDSPRYGERWARHWMDAAHFAETHGHDQDRIRENAWPYRDYLINALNSDKSYRRFVEEQIAGDVLYPDEPSVVPALGFLAAGPWDESSLRDIREDTIDRQIGRYLDRDDIVTNVMNNFVSSTVQCARCHDHKFDPISQADYYSLQAVFSGVERANRAFDTDPAVNQLRRTLRSRKSRLESEGPARREELLSEAAQSVVTAWEQKLNEARSAWKILAPQSAISSAGATLTALADNSVLSSNAAPEQDTYTLTFPIPAGEFTALRLETLTHDSLPQHGPGRQENGNLHLSEIEVYVGGIGERRIDLARAAADFDQVDWGVARAIDGNPQTAWGIYPMVGQSHVAMFEFKQKQATTEGQTLTVVLKQLHGGHHLIGRVRIAVSAAPPELAVMPPEKIETILAVAPARRSEDQRFELALYQQQTTLASEIAQLPQPSYVYAAASDFEPDGGLKPPPGPRPIRILKRGDIRQPLEEVAPGALGCVSSVPARFEVGSGAAEGDRRVALARWLTDSRNPLTWRSIVNRVWQLHFGRGIVATPNDFGRMGSLPTHPELLDWLAAWFRDNGQSLKRLHYLIVTSATYRQSSAARPAEDVATKLDVDNQYLWRMNRSRLDAESIRDAMLSATGKLDLRMGGPSDRQFSLTPGSHVTPIIDYSKFDLDSPLSNRRSVYRFLFRTLPDPFMESLDCPAGDTITPVRDNTVTVQQALALWNDALVARRSEQFAERLRTLGNSTPEQVDAALRLTLGRQPTEAEKHQLAAYADAHGLENLCRVLFNLNEFVFVN